MKCPSCSSTRNGVTDSRPTDGGLSIRRRRECNDCGDRYTTWECTTNLLWMRRDLLSAAASLSAALGTIRESLDQLRAIERAHFEGSADARSDLTNAQPVIHDFKVNAGGSNVSAD